MSYGWRKLQDLTQFAAHAASTDSESAGHRDKRHNADNTTSLPQTYTFAIWVKTLDSGLLNNAYTGFFNRTVRYTRFN